MAHSPLTAICAHRIVPSVGQLLLLPPPNNKHKQLTTEGRHYHYAATWHAISDHRATGTFSVLSLAQTLSHFGTHSSVFGSFLCADSLLFVSLLSSQAVGTWTVPSDNCCIKWPLGTGPHVHMVAVHWRHWPTKWQWGHQWGTFHHSQLIYRLPSGVHYVSAQLAPHKLTVHDSINTSAFTFSAILCHSSNDFFMSIVQNWTAQSTQLAPCLMTNSIKRSNMLPNSKWMKKKTRTDGHWHPLFS